MFHDIVLIIACCFDSILFFSSNNLCKLPDQICRAMKLRVSLLRLDICLCGIIQCALSVRLCMLGRTISRHCLEISVVWRDWKSWMFLEMLWNIYLSHCLSASLCRDFGCLIIGEEL